MNQFANDSAPFGMAQQAARKQMCSTVQCFRRMSDNAGTNLAAIEPVDVPSLGAPRTLERLQANHSNYTEVIKPIDAMSDGNFVTRL